MQKIKTGVEKSKVFVPSPPPLHGRPGLLQGQRRWKQGASNYYSVLSPLPPNLITSNLPATAAGLLPTYAMDIGGRRQHTHPHTIRRHSSFHGQNSQTNKHIVRLETKYTHGTNLAEYVARSLYPPRAFPSPPRAPGDTKSAAGAQEESWTPFSILKHEALLIGKNSSNQLRVYLII